MAPVSDTSIVGSYRSLLTATAGFTTDGVKFITPSIVTRSASPAASGLAMVAVDALSIGVTHPASVATIRTVVASIVRAMSSMAGEAPRGADKRSSARIDQPSRRGVERHRVQRRSVGHDHVGRDRARREHVDRDVRTV